MSHISNISAQELFQSDEDRAIINEMRYHLRIDEYGWKCSLTSIIYKPEKWDGFRTTQDAEKALDEMISEIRHRLDTDGLGEKLFDRSRHTPHPLCSKEYHTLLLGGIMMRVGAKISMHMRSMLHLCNPAHVLDTPSVRTQYIMALDRYRSGAPRDFEEDLLVDCVPDVRGLYIADCFSLAVLSVVGPRVILGANCSFVTFVTGYIVAG
jgi:hypothetical protein